MRSGALRDRIEIYSTSHPRDGAGAVSESSTLVATVYGQVVPLSGRERIVADQSLAHLMAHVRLRYYSGLTPTHFLKLGARTFRITAVLNPDGRKIEHLVDVVEQVGA